MPGNTFSSIDRQFIWHPFTQEKTCGPRICIEKAKGLYLYDEQGKAYMDLVSSWYVNLHGHANSYIAEAIHCQAEELGHVIFAGFTHKPAVQLVSTLRGMLPPSLRKFFFSDNGSTAVEVGLKMAYQYWYNRKEVDRKIFISFEGAYHGDTFGSMGVSNAFYHQAFKPLCFASIAIPFAEASFDEPEPIEAENAVLRQLEKLLQTRAREIAAMIFEPLVQAAGGMRLCRPVFIDKLVALLRKHNILIIFDEVMTAFSRTGKLFALDYLNYVPDILCLAKGLTGGFLPLALTITTEEIYNAFLDDTFERALAHGHSYTANPLGCAAAKASLEILVNPQTQSKVQEINKIHLQRLCKLKEVNPRVTQPRVLGTIAAFNLDESKFSYMYNLTPHLKSIFLEKGLLIRPLGNVLYLLPPYCITSRELNHAYDVIEDVLRIL